MLPGLGRADGTGYTITLAATNPESYSRLRAESLRCPMRRRSNPLPGADRGHVVNPLAPSTLGLGQVVPFFFKIAVAGGAPAGGSIEMRAGWATLTSNGQAFGYDAASGLACAFVDSADTGSLGGDGNASVSLASSTVQASSFRGTIRVTGLDPGETVVVEAWVMLTSASPAASLQRGR